MTGVSNTEQTELIPTSEDATVNMDGFANSGWQAIELLGSGTSGQVWKVRNLSDGTVAAAKVLRSDLAQKPGVAQRFVQEKKLVEGIRHRNVVGVYAVQQLAGGLTIFMEYVDSGDLETLLKSAGTLSPAQVVYYAAEVARGLAKIHSEGIVHRDLKPSNIMLKQQGEYYIPKIADFGLARWIDPQSDAQTTKRSGTPYYMAPEMIEGQGVSAKTDIYSLGVIMYQLLTGTPPFKGSIAQVLHQQFHHMPGKIPNLPPALWNLISSLMAKEPSVRPNAQQLVDQLAQLAPSLQNHRPLPKMEQPPAAVPLENVVRQLPGGAASALDSVRPIVLSKEEHAMGCEQTNQPAHRFLSAGEYSFRNAPEIWLLAACNIAALVLLFGLAIR